MALRLLTPTFSISMPPPPAALTCRTQALPPQSQPGTGTMLQWVTAPTYSGHFVKPSHSTCYSLQTVRPKLLHLLLGMGSQTQTNRVTDLSLVAAPHFSPCPSAAGFPFPAGGILMTLPSQDQQFMTAAGGCSLQTSAFREYPDIQSAAHQSVIY